VPHDDPVRPKYFVEFCEMMIQPMTGENAFKTYCAYVYLVIKLVQQDA
jgi:hypothetical protein